MRADWAQPWDPASAHRRLLHHCRLCNNVFLEPTQKWGPPFRPFCFQLWWLFNSLLWVTTHKRGATESTDPSRVIICSVRRVAGVVLAELSALLSSPSLRHQMALELSSLTFAAPQQPQPGGHSSNTAFNTKQNIESPKRTCTYLSFHNTLHGGPLTQDKTISLKGLSKSRCC